MYWLSATQIQEDVTKATDVWFTHSSDTSNYREYVIKLTHILPAATLGVELVLNKIRIPWHHVFANMFLVACYLLASYIGQIYSLTNYSAIYYHSLNFDC